MGEKGFTLIEVLASVAILGLGIVAVTRLFSGSLRLARASSDAASKVLVAKEKMSEVLLEKKIGEGIQSGSSGEFKWILNVKKIDGPRAQNSPDIFSIDLSVSGEPGAPFRLITLKAYPK